MQTAILNAFLKLIAENQPMLEELMLEGLKMLLAWLKAQNTTAAA